MQQLNSSSWLLVMFQPTYRQHNYTHHIMQRILKVIEINYCSVIGYFTETYWTADERALAVIPIAVRVSANIAMQSIYACPKQVQVMYGIILRQNETV